MSAETRKSRWLTAALDYRSSNKTFDHQNCDWGNGLIVVTIDTSYDVPIEAYGIGAKWVNSFNETGVVNALNSL